MSKKSKKISNTPISDWAKRVRKVTYNPELDKYENQEPSPSEKEKIRKCVEMIKAPGGPKELYEKK